MWSGREVARVGVGVGVGVGANWSWGWGWSWGTNGMCTIYATMMWLNKTAQKLASLHLVYDLGITTGHGAGASRCAGSFAVYIRAAVMAQGSPITHKGSFELGVPAKTHKRGHVHDHRRILRTCEVGGVARLGLGLQCWSWRRIRARGLLLRQAVWLGFGVWGGACAGKLVNLVLSF